MTTETFLETLRFIVKLDDDLKLQAQLDTISATLTNLVQSPAEPSYQSALATALERFSSSAAKLGEALGPSQLTQITSVGGQEFLDPLIAEKIRRSIETNAMTPSVARDFVKNLTTRRASFFSTVDKTIEGLEAFGIEGGDLAPGVADLAFTIPRELFDDQLGSFAKELSFISRLMLQYSEAVTGKAEPVRLRGLSSSIPTVALLADAQTIGAFAGLITAFLAAWEKVEKIRKIRADMAEIGIRRNSFDDLTEEITTTITQVVEESTVVVLKTFKGDPGRKNELQNGLRRDTAKLFARIERGMTVQFRATPDKSANAEDQEALETVNRFGRVLQFPKVHGEPILLLNGELENEEVATQVGTKTTTNEASSKGRPSTRHVAEGRERQRERALKDPEQGL